MAGLLAARSVDFIGPVFRIRTKGFHPENPA
jgi:hypothetical protein